jgi:hypothetical protein
MGKKRIIALIILVLVMGIGFGFVKIVLPVWRDSAPALLIEEQKAPVTTESGVEGHRDLRFRNEADRRLTISLEHRNCECARVQICITPDEWKELDSPAFLSHATEPALAWQILEQGGKFVVIPPRSHGLIRVGWKAIKVGPSSIGIVLRVNGGGREITQRLETPVEFVAPAYFCSADDPTATEIDLGRLKPGEERTAHFLCCSTTREKFTLTPAPPNNDPCILYGTPEPLTPKEMQALTQKYGTAHLRGGYHVKVTLREQAGDHRLDIGPFHRRIVYKTDVYPEHQVTTHVNGTVEGEVWLASSDGKDFIDFGTIIPTNPKPTTFTLETRDPQLQLTVDDERTLPHFKVELLDGKDGKPTDQGKRWQVRVKFRTDALFRGEFPNPDRRGYDSADLCSLVFLLSRPGQTTSIERRFLGPTRGKVRSY